VVALGQNDNGQCDVSNWTDIIQVAAGRYHTVGLKADGTVVTVGYDNYGQCDVANWADIVQVTAGYFSTAGLESDGTVVAVGRNDYGQCNVSGWTDIVQVSAGWGYTVGLKADGTVLVAGAEVELAKWNLGDTTRYLTISGTTGGEVTLPGAGTYPCYIGRVLNLAVKPEDGYRFVNWTGDVGTIARANAAQTTITMNGDYSITANFGETPAVNWALLGGILGAAAIMGLAILFVRRSRAARTRKSMSKTGHSRKRLASNNK
jgi:hypothetical protein